MTPKLKAAELIEKYESLNTALSFHRAKSCAIICVKEILEACSGIYDYDEEILVPYWSEVLEILQQSKS
jgi:hypothetical protein